MLKTTLLTLLFLAVALMAPSGLSAEPQEPGQETIPQEGVPGAGETEEQIQGSLVRVDTAAQTIAVADATGQEMELKYNEQTEVTGGESSVEGLASKQGTQVTVHWKNEGGDKLATKIELSAEEGQF